MASTTAPSGEHGHHGGEEHDAHGHHVMSPQILIGVYLALMFFTWLTVAVSGKEASAMLGDLSMIVAMLVASIKASLVGLYFMHLRYDRPFNALVFVSSLFFVALFIITVSIDVGQYLPQLEVTDTAAN